MSDYEELRRRFRDLLREHPHNLYVVDDDGPLQKLQVRKMSAFVPVSDELLHPEKYPVLKISRRTRFRWWRNEMRARIRFAWSALRHGHDCGDY